MKYVEIKSSQAITRAQRKHNIYINKKKWVEQLPSFKNWRCTNVVRLN